MKFETMKMHFTYRMAKDLSLEISIDMDFSKIKKDEAIFCQIEIVGEKEERRIFECFIPFGVTWEKGDLTDLFLNEAKLFLTSATKSGIIDLNAFDASNPEVAWLYYKKTRDLVFAGNYIGKRITISGSIHASYEGKDVFVLYEGKNQVFLEMEGRRVRLANQSHGLDNEDGTTRIVFLDGEKPQEGECNEYLFDTIPTVCGYNIKADDMEDYLRRIEEIVKLFQASL